MNYTASNLDPTQRYKLLVGAIVPRPIAWVSTISPAGVVNVAPFSFFCGVSANPWALAFCPSIKPDGHDKDTLHNIDSDASCHQFVVNIVDEAHAQKMSITAADLPANESEADVAKLNMAPSTHVQPPRIASAPVSFECERLAVHRLLPGEPNSGVIVVGRILCAHVQDQLIDERHRIDPTQLRAVGRLAGLTYATTRELFELPWGLDALDAEPPDILNS
ncbi:MAG: flavin reductase family protein [Planctomycetota bacterium]|jgi:flavin reductase (DIM6/NTAB) family NADH-FMN oxidoreductase RutF